MCASSTCTCRAMSTATCSRINIAWSLTWVVIGTYIWFVVRLVWLVRFMVRFIWPMIGFAWFVGLVIRFMVGLMWVATRVVVMPARMSTWRRWRRKWPMYWRWRQKWVVVVIVAHISSVPPSST